MRGDLMRIFYVFGVLLVSMQLKSAENNKDSKFYIPKQKVASTQEANQFKEECLKQNIPSSCFDYGVHLAQTLNQESESLIYYDKSCKMEFEATCFNKGFILIKELKTRTAGLEYLQKICDSKEKTNLDPDKNEMIKFSC